jgi:hypothetical protein
MNETPSQVTGNRTQEYNTDSESPTTGPASSGPPQVVVPPGPPQFGPASSRAFLRLLLALHRKRAPHGTPSEEDQ